MIYGSSLGGYLSILLLLFLLRASSVDLSTLESELLCSVSITLKLTHLERKQAAPIMGIDESTLGKQLDGVPGYPLSLTRLFRLPITFWLAFTPVLISLVLKKHLSEVADELTLSRRA